MSRRKLIVIGGGNMGGAIVRRAIAAGIVPASETLVAEVDPAKREAFGIAGVRTFETADVAVADAASGDIVLLAVKPQMFEGVVPAIAAGAAGGCLVVSIMAGVTLARLRAAAGGSSKVVRVMPNLPASIGEGISAIARNVDGALNEAEVSSVRAVFEAVGRVCEIDEGLMDAFTAVGGSGPAYLFYLAEGMERGATEQGFSAEQARFIVVQTLLGAARLLADRAGEGCGPAALRAEVTSRGGTTEAASQVLDQRAVLASLAEAIGAAKARGTALAAMAAQGPGQIQ